ncbi:MAG: VOC family protein [Planctomycetota bacterium]|jgi:PhnB protein
MTDVKPIPDGFHTVTPYLLIDGAAEAIEFYKKAFSAEVTLSMPSPEGKVMHAEIRVGDSPIMLGEAPENAASPNTLGGTPVLIHLYVPDVDTVFMQAVAAGADIVTPVTDQFYGDRNGHLVDPFGHHWTISTHTEDLTDEEINERASKLYGG